MNGAAPPVGTRVVLEKAALQAVIDELRRQGYRTLGPQVAEGAVVYRDLARVEDLPLGTIDLQDGGLYRLTTDPQAGYFDHVVGPHSLKSFVFPPRETILTAQRHSGDWTLSSPEPEAPPTAVLGIRSCDLHALAVQDRIFLHGPYVDPGYQKRRAALLLVAVHCRRAAATCFCHSLGTGPAVTSPCDLALTELEGHFVVDVGSERGAALLAAAPWKAALADEAEHAARLPRELAERMAQRSGGEGDAGGGAGSRQRSLDTTNIRNLLLGNLDHPRWQEVAERCLACGNCTMVCPTCFCSSVEEVTDLSGDHTTRERVWSSCYSAEHSYLSGGSVRSSIAARYRQWLTHKLAGWIDQFGVSGCVGCGRCITWCPVGIDLTEEVAAIREGAPER